MAGHANREVPPKGSLVDRREIEPASRCRLCRHQTTLHRNGIEHFEPSVLSRMGRPRRDGDHTFGIDQMGSGGALPQFPIYLSTRLRAVPKEGDPREFGTSNARRKKSLRKTRRSRQTDTASTL